MPKAWLRWTLFLVLAAPLPLQAACPKSAEGAWAGFSSWRPSPVSAELADEAAFEKRLAAQAAAYAESLANAAGDAWWNTETAALQSCASAGAAEGPDAPPPPLQIFGDKRTRLLVLLAPPTTGSYIQHFPFLLLRGRPNLVFPLAARLTRCEAPGALWLEWSPGAEPRLAVGSNSCGINPLCYFETFQIRGRGLEPQPLKIGREAPQHRFSLPAWQAPHDIACPALLKGGQWVKKLNYYEVNTDCPGGAKPCPEFRKREVSVTPVARPHVND